MNRMVAVIGGGAFGVAIMLGILQPWNQLVRKTEPTEVVATIPAGITDPLDKAEHLIGAGELAVARGFLEEKAESAKSHALLALIEIRSANPKAAQASLAKAASIDPQLFEIALFQGHLDMLLHEHRAATRSYTEAMKRRPNDSRARTGRAAARFQLGEFAGAVEDATMAIQSEPDAYFTRAAAYAELGRHEESARDWTSYLALKPNDAHAWMNRGNAHERLGKKSAAVADWQEAVRLDPKLAEKLEPLINR